MEDGKLYASMTPLLGTTCSRLWELMHINVPHMSKTNHVAGSKDYSDYWRMQVIPLNNKFHLLYSTGKVLAMRKTTSRKVRCFQMNQK